MTVSRGEDFVARIVIASLDEDLAFAEVILRSGDPAPGDVVSNRPVLYIPVEK